MSVTGSVSVSDVCGVCVCVCGGGSQAYLLDELSHVFSLAFYFYLQSS